MLVPHGYSVATGRDLARGGALTGVGRRCHAETRVWIYGQTKIPGRTNVWMQYVERLG